MKNIKFDRISNRKEVDWAYMTAIRKLNLTKNTLMTLLKRFLD